MPSDRLSVLSVGADERLVRLRHQVLQQAGFSIFTTREPAEAVSPMKEHAYGAVLLCHTLSESAQQLLISNYRKHCPGGRIIGISNVPWRQPGDLDAIVYGAEGPAALIQVIIGPKAA